MGNKHAIHRQQNQLRRILCGMLAALVLFAMLPASAQEGQVFRQPSELFDIRITTQTSKREREQWIDQVITPNPEVNAALEAAKARLLEQAQPQLTEHNHQLELTISYRVSGDSWASFLMMVRVCKKRQTIWMEADCLSFDMRTGKALTLVDLFPEDSGVWPLMAESVRQGLLQAYPSEKKDEAALEALTNRKALQTQPFMVGVYQLSLPLKLWQLLPEHPQLVHVQLYYDQLASFVRPEIKHQLDNSGYKLLALTFDDGPHNAYTRRSLATLGQQGGVATFFIVGHRLFIHSEAARRVLDQGCLLGGHSMQHRYSKDINPNLAAADQARLVETMLRYTGHSPSLYRAPGGQYANYHKGGVNLPHLGWTVGAEPEGKPTAGQVVSRALGQARHLALMLMHEVEQSTVQALPMIVQTLKDRGYLLATVEELFRMQGTQLLPGYSYHDAALPGQPLPETTSP